MRRSIVIPALALTALFGFGGVASAAAAATTTVETVTASSDNEGQITFTDDGVAATVNYGTAADSLINSVTLAPHQVLTVSLGDNTDTIYWQSVSPSGDSLVHKQDTSDPFLGFLEGILIGLLIVVFVVALCAIAFG